MEAGEIRRYLLSICRQRKRLNRYGFSRRSRQLSDDFVFSLEKWLHAFPNASTKGVATFFLSNQDKIYYIIPTPKQNTSLHRRFFEILEFSKEYLASQKSTV